MASPTSQAHPRRQRLLGFDGEDNEIADFVDDRAERVAADALGRFPQLLRALAGAGAFVQQRTDIDWFSIRPAHRGSAATSQPTDG